MDFLSLADSRYSCRKYSDKAVEPEKIEQILLAGRSAPTAHNNQPQEIIVLRSEEALKLLEKCTACRYHAPLAFIICYRKSRAWVREYDGKCSGDVDASIVTTHMMLEAKALGLDSVWLMYFIPEAVTTEFQLEEDVVPVAILCAGYSAEGASPAHSARLPLSRTVTYR